MTPRDPASKVMSWNALRDWRSSFWGRVVFTNGVFDLLHPGHIDILNAARAAGDALVVGINGDDSVRRLKGESRPIRSQVERAYVVAALEAVDVVTVFDEDTPLDLVRCLEPDVIAKGGDYTEATIVGASDVRERGGDVLVIPLTPGQSTTSIIERMRE
ncbi:MAG TPA: D-glycero-beta-D-manno-heptose 1-phosphate adenylyltransferase [Gemmatimonadaceae bacterium]